MKHLVSLSFLLLFSVSLAQTDKETTISPTGTTQGQGVQNPGHMIGREPDSSNQAPPAQTTEQGQSGSEEPSGEPTNQSQNPDNGPDGQPGQQEGQTTGQNPAAAGKCYVSCHLMKGSSGTVVPSEGEIIPTDVDPVVVEAGHPYYNGFPNYYYGGGPFPFHSGPFGGFGPGPFGRWKRQTVNGQQRMKVVSGTGQKDGMGLGQGVFTMELNGSLYSCQKICK